MTASANFLSAIDDLLVVRLYGKKVEDLNIVATKEKGKNSPLMKAYGESVLSFAWIYGAKVLGACRRLPTPLLLLVPEPDSDPLGCEDFSDPKQYRMWVLPKGGPLVKLIHQVVTAEEVVSAGGQPLLNVDFDFHVHDVQISGTVVSGKLRSFLRVQGFTVVDRDDSFSIDFSSLPCVTVFSIAVASAQICYHPNPNRICGEIVVGVDLPWPIGHWGQTFQIACVNF
jgi:hypothetical protein